MANTDAPLGPSANNVTNLDGSPLSYFQRSNYDITGDTVSIVYKALLGSAVVHNNSIKTFTDALNECAFFVEGYDNSKLVCFGAIKILSTQDLDILNQYYGGYGVSPYGTDGYGGVFSYKGIFGELRYVYQDPDYSGLELGNKVVDLLMQSQSDFVSPSDSRTILCVIPTPIPDGTQYDYLRYLQSQQIQDMGVTFSNKAIANTSAFPYYNVNSHTSLLTTLFK